VFAQNQKIGKPNNFIFVVLEKKTKAPKQVTYT
jgi:hypothetical protein